MFSCMTHREVRAVMFDLSVDIPCPHRATAAQSELSNGFHRAIISKGLQGVMFKSHCWTWRVSSGPGLRLGAAAAFSSGATQDKSVSVRAAEWGGRAAAQGYS